MVPWLRSIPRPQHFPVASLSDPRPVLANNLGVLEPRIRRALRRRQVHRGLPGHK